MSTPPRQVTIQNGEQRTVVIYGAPRGREGPPAPAAQAGPAGRSIVIRGAWDGNIEYGPGDGVQSRTLASPGLQALWIVKETGNPTPGVQPFQEPSEWMEISATSSAEEGAVYRVSQISHPFTMVGQPVTFSAVTARYQLADARDPNLLAMGVVCEILDNQEFSVQLNGRIMGVDPFLIFDPATPAERGTSDWIPGAIYYLSSVPGMLQVTSPRRTGIVEMPVATPINEQGDLLLLNWGPSLTFPPVDLGEVPAPVREGELWYRRDAYPGLYTSIYDTTRTRLMWVQSNG